MRGTVRRIAVAVLASIGPGLAACATPEAAPPREFAPLPRAVLRVPAEPEAEDSPGPESEPAASREDARKARRPILDAQPTSGNWSAIPTGHYIVLSAEGVDRGLVRTLGKRIELLRTTVLERRFPTAPEEGRLVVRICADYAHYVRFGGPAGVAGHFDAHGGEIVLYQDLTDRNSTIEIAQSLVCMAYIGRASGGRRASAWLRRGLEGWAAAHVASPRGPAVHLPSRHRVIASDLKRRGRAPGLAELFAWREVTATPDGSRGKLDPGEMRSLAVDFVEFVMSSEDPAVSEIPARYMKAFTGGASRDASLEAALRGVDLEALEREWLGDGP